MANPSCPLCGSHTDLGSRDPNTFVCRNDSCRHQFVDAGVV